MCNTIPWPQCGAPAAITERFWLDSTDGPIEHPKIGCLSKHWFTPRAETVQSGQVATADRELAALPSRLVSLPERARQARPAPATTASHLKPRRPSMVRRRPVGSSGSEPPAVTTG